jgi:hypothetical protein
LNRLERGANAGVRLSAAPDRITRDACGRLNRVQVSGCEEAMREPRPSFCDRLLFIASLAAFAPGFACASDLDLSLAGRPCLNGTCLRGYECIDAVCVPASSSSGDGVAMADSGGLMFDKDSGVLFPGSSWLGNEKPDAGDKDAPAPEDGGGISVPLDDAGTIAGAGGMSGTGGSGTGGTGGTSTSGGAGGTGGLQASGGTGGVEPPPPACESDQLCAGACVDTLNDAAHCGRCDNACASVEVCIQGECRAECEPPEGIEIGIDIDLDGDDDECPEACDSCIDGTCELRCDGEQACKERVVDCPEGYACVIECSGKQACEKLHLECADGTLCSLRCAGEQACKDAVIDCGSSHCEVLCIEGMDACEKTQLQCGTGACGAVCGMGQRKPDIQDCMSSCSLGCGCGEP